MKLDSVLMDVIVCPVCHERLRPSSLDAAVTGVTGELLCATCAVAYPVHDDVPVLLVHYARPLAEADGSAAGAGAE